MNLRTRLVLLPGLVFSALGLSGCNQDQTPPKTAIAQNAEDTERTINEAIGKTEEHADEQSEDTKKTIERGSQDAERSREQSAEDTKKTIEGDPDE